MFGSMASEIMNEILTEDKLVQMWPDFPCLYDEQSPAFKNRDLHQQAMETIASTLDAMLINNERVQHYNT